MLVDDLKQRIAHAVKSGDAVARDVLRLALGEIQTAEARRNSALSDDEARAAIKKLVKSNQETLELTGDGERQKTLRHEIEVLEQLLPKALSAQEIAAALASHHDAIKAAGNDGQATGIAMKHFKASGAAVNAPDVAAAVKVIREGG